MGPGEIAVIVIASAFVVGVIAWQIYKKYKAKKSGGSVGCCGCCSSCSSCSHCAPTKSENTDQK